MNEALKGLEMRPLYIELWLMKWKNLNGVLSYSSKSPMKKASRRVIAFLQLHLKVKPSSLFSKWRPTVKILGHQNF